MRPAAVTILEELSYYDLKLRMVVSSYSSVSGNSELSLACESVGAGDQRLPERQVT